MSEIEIRGFDPKDLAFMFATWLRAYQGSSYFAKKIKRDVFFDRHHMVIERILARPSSRVLVAHVKDDPNVIIGYLVAEADTLHFVFVKREFRRMGVARELLNASGLDYLKSYFTHWTFDADALLEKLPGITYDPYRI